MPGFNPLILCFRSNFDGWRCFHPGTKRYKPNMNYIHCPVLHNFTHSAHHLCQILWKYPFKSAPIVSHLSIKATEAVYWYSHYRNWSSQIPQPTRLRDSPKDSLKDFLPNFSIRFFWDGIISDFVEDSLGKTSYWTWHIIWLPSLCWFIVVLSQVLIPCKTEELRSASHELRCDRISRRCSANTFLHSSSILKFFLNWDRKKSCFSLIVSY